jgi:hypothetical protein
MPAKKRLINIDDQDADWLHLPVGRISQPMTKHPGHADQKVHAGGRAVADALLAGQRVSVPPAKVGAALAAIQDSDAATADLTLMHVEGTDLFDSGGLGIARADMPQIPSRNREMFVSQMRDSGIGVTEESVSPMSLKPTQRELNAVNTAQMASSIRDGSFPSDAKPLFVSSDGYVLDGHHRWAAAASVEMSTGSSPIRVTRVDLPIRDLLRVASDFNTAQGIAARGLGDVGSGFRKMLERWFGTVVKHPGHPDQKVHAGGRGGLGGGAADSSAYDPSRRGSLRQRRAEQRAQRREEMQRTPRAEPGIPDNAPDEVRRISDDLSDRDDYSRFVDSCDTGGGCEDIAQAVESEYSIRQVHGEYTTPSGEREYHSWNQTDNGVIVDAGQSVFADRDTDGKKGGAEVLVFSAGAPQYEMYGYGPGDAETVLGKGLTPFEAWFGPVIKHPGHPDQKIHGRKGGGIHSCITLMGVSADDPVVRKHLDDLATVPTEVMDAYESLGGRIDIVDGPITAHPEMAHLAGVKPTGWPPGTSWDDVPGAGPQRVGMPVILGTRGESGSASVAVHELGHGLDTYLGDAIAPGSGFKLSDSLEEAHKSVRWSNPYYRQAGSQGRREAFAEAVAVAYMKPTSGSVDHRGGARSYTKAAIDAVDQAVTYIASQR